ncbi:MAG: FKBP-type peptidyl-prolyl cis-trans isomerase [Ilumatobacter sp.]|uniref:FKBP-type peptidyl-prolyl cis-trans isomerase n=1 Tax=Ilumatobacter sp. TaxID=1967498 RepID=UPI003298DAE2
MRRTLAISAFIALTLAACGDDDSSTPVSLPPAEGAVPETTTTTLPPDYCVPVGGELPDTVPEAFPETTEPDETETGNTQLPETSDPETDGTDPETSEPETGEADDAETDGTDPVTSEADEVAVDKPEVEIPAEAPTELVRTVLVEGTGEEAESGDTVIVDYTGVRSSDGLPFDNSYDRGEPFPVVLGQGSVIQGWDDGLVGSQTGERVQLDIPSEQAYGETQRSEVICANENLSFVIDVRAVIKAGDPADAPTEPGVDLSPAPGVDDTVFEDLVDGDGDTLEVGDTAVIRYVNFVGDTGEVIETNWGTDPLQVPYGENLLPGLLEGMEGMKVGGQRAITIPPEDGFGEAGSPEAGLPADTDMIFVVELAGKY